MPSSDVVRAQAAITAYEQANPDVPQPGRRWLALGSVARRFYKRTLAEALGEPMPHAPWRDRSWFWWNVLATCGLEDRWESFKDDVRALGLRQAYRALRATLSCSQRAVLARRCGLKDAHLNPRPTRNVIWTKGGSWRIESNFTKLIVLKQPLGRRIFRRPWHHKLNQDGVERLEREIMAVVNPDTELAPDARAHAVDYFRRRLPEMLGWKIPRASTESAAWFFMTDLPSSGGRQYVAYDRWTGHTVRFKGGQSLVDAVWSW